MEWNLRTCARKGHVTYRPREEDLAARLTATTAAGVAWRCLRCGDFVLGEPVASGPADHAPLVLRGRALRDATVLRVLAVERMLRAFLLVLIGYAVLRFRSSEARVQAVFDRALPAAKPLANVLHLDLDSSPTVTKLRHLVHTKPDTLLVVAVLLFGYAAIQVVEGVGLWRMERWGEYFATVATSLFLPLEVYELTERVTVLRVLALVVNVALVVYLLLAKRLFGLRGGRAAYEDERADESLLEVRRSAGVTVADPARPPATSQASPPATDPAGHRPGLARDGGPPVTGH